MSVPEAGDAAVAAHDDIADAEAERIVPTQFPCESCGAVLSYEPGTRQLKCSYCGHENAIPESEQDIEELDFATALRRPDEAADTETTQSVSCQSCGASFTFDANLHSDSCPFCGSTAVAEPQTDTHLRPRSLLPFAIDRKSAKERFREWLSKLWFAPDAVKRYARTEGGFAGMYVPYWTYDSHTTTAYSGQRGINYTVSVPYTTTVNGKTVTRTRMETRTRWYRVSGTVWRTFDDVLVLASDSLPRKYTERLEPWDLASLTTYDEKYLSGFRSETYRVGLEDGFELAKQTMDRTIRRDVRRDIGGDKQRILSLRTRHANVTFKHVLLPIWVAAYRYRDKVYRFVVNGRTGEVQGERPWSWLKIGLAVLGVAAVIGGAAYLFSIYGG